MEKEIVEASKKNDNQFIEEIDNQNEYSLSMVFTEDKFKEIVKHKFEKKELTFQPGVFTKLSKTLHLRQKHVYYNIITKEYATRIDESNSMKLITKKEINDVFNQIDKKKRNSIKFLHVGGIEILIEALFREGLDTPIGVTVRDGRIRNYEESILGKISGNLCYKKIGFTVYPGYSIAITDRNIQDVLTLDYNFQKKNLMKEGNSPITIKYVMGITLSNQSGLDIKKDHDHLEIHNIFRNVTEKTLPKRIFIEEERIGETDKELLEELRQRHTRQPTLEKSRSSRQIRYNPTEHALESLPKRFSTSSRIPESHTERNNEIEPFRSEDLRRNIERINRNVEVIKSSIGLEE